MHPRLQGLRFRPRLWAFALSLAVCAAGVSLGNWQSGRAEGKRALAERLAQAARAAPHPVPASPAASETLLLRRLGARGEFLPQFTVLLDNKVYRGRPGYFVVTPLRLAGGKQPVLVNRGWIAAAARREDLPDPKTPPGEVTVEGFGLAHPPRVLDAGGGPQRGRVRQSLALQAFAQETGLALQPVFLEQHSGLDDGLVRDWPAADFGIQKHEGYAIQWYLLAALSMVLFFVLSVRRDRPASS